MDSKQAKMFVAFALDRRYVTREEVEKCKAAQKNHPGLEVPEILVKTGALDLSEALEIEKTLWQHGIKYQIDSRKALVGDRPEEKTALRSLSREAESAPVKAFRRRRRPVSKKAIYGTIGICVLLALIVFGFLRARKRSKEFWASVHSARTAMRNKEFVSAVRRLKVARDIRDESWLKKEIENAEYELLLQRLQSTPSLASQYQLARQAYEATPTSRIHAEMKRIENLVKQRRMEKRQKQLMHDAAEAEKGERFALAYELYRQARDLAPSVAIQKAIAEFMRKHGDKLDKAKQDLTLKKWQNDMDHLVAQRAYYSRKYLQARKEMRIRDASEFARYRDAIDDKINKLRSKKPEE